MSLKNVQNKFTSPVYINQEMIRSEHGREDLLDEKSKLSEHNLSQNTEKTKKALSKVTTGLNEMVKVFNRKIDFVVHDDTNRTMVKVIDTENGRVLREIPPEEILDLVAKMQEAFGIIFDVKV